MNCRILGCQDKQWGQTARWCHPPEQPLQGLGEVAVASMSCLYWRSWGFLGLFMWKKFGAPEHLSQILEPVFDFHIFFFFNFLLLLIIIPHCANDLRIALESWKNGSGRRGERNPILHFSMRSKTAGQLGPEASIQEKNKMNYSEIWRMPRDELCYEKTIQLNKKGSQSANKWGEPQSRSVYQIKKSINVHKNKARTYTRTLQTHSTHKLCNARQSCHTFQGMQWFFSGTHL